MPAWFSYTALVDGNVLSAADINTPLSNAANGTVAVANGGTNLTSGTSGGILYYSAAGTLASTAALTANGVVYGGGAGVAPAATAQGGTRTILTANAGVPAWSAAPIINNSAQVGVVSSTTGTLLLAHASSANLTTITPSNNTAARTLTLPNATGTVGLVSGLTSIQFVRKTADESVTSSTTLQNDDTLLVALAANEVVAFTCNILFDAIAAGDIKVAFTVPAAATLIWNYAGGVGVNAAVTVAQFTGVTSSGASQEYGSSGAGNQTPITIHGTVANGANAGDLTLQWAQNTSDATATTVKANSWLMVWRV